MFLRPTKMVSGILILSIIIITTICLMNLSKHRRIINSSEEGMAVNYGVSNINLSSDTYSLKEYFIKSSYNSAYSGTTVSTEQVKDILKRGCRFLDFEVFYIDGKAQVAYSTDPYRITIDSDNKILLSDVFDTLITDGFANAPNSGDPLFIQLRIKSKPTIDVGIFPLIVASIQSKLGNRLYSGKVSGETQIRDLMNKVILVVDQKTCPEYLNYNDLVALTNMTSAGKLLHKNDYSTTIQMFAIPVTANSNGTTDVSNTMKMTETPDPDIQNTILGKWKIYKHSIFRIFILAIIIMIVMIVYYAMKPTNFVGKSITEKLKITLFTILEKFKNIFAFFIFIILFSMVILFSFTNEGNPPFQSLVSDYGVQIVEYKFYLQDNALKEYEDVFRNAHTSFIPFSKII